VRVGVVRGAHEVDVHAVDASCVPHQDVTDLLLVHERLQGRRTSRLGHGE